MQFFLIQCRTIIYHGATEAGPVKKFVFLAKKKALSDFLSVGRKCISVSLPRLAVTTHTHLLRSLLFLPVPRVVQLSPSFFISPSLTCAFSLHHCRSLSLTCLSFFSSSPLPSPTSLYFFPITHPSLYIFHRLSLLHLPIPDEEGPGYILPRYVLMDLSYQRLRRCEVSLSKLL